MNWKTAANEMLSGGGRRAPWRREKGTLEEGGHPGGGREHPEEGSELLAQGHRVL